MNPMNTKSSLAFLLALLSFVAPAAAQEAPAEADLSARLEQLRADANLPGLAGALVTVDGLQGTWVAGHRRAGGEEKVEADDQWHLGSCTKSMTATLIALLVTRGDLAWDRPIGEELPELATEMDEAFLDLTLVELLCHRAGIASNPPDLHDEDFEGTDMVAQRALLTKATLCAAPLHPPRTTFLYSNTGFVIAGHIAEVATGKTWETLMRELLFEPLGMKTAGFGPPGSSTVCDQPWGHTSDGHPLKPGPDADNPPVIGPAGTVHASLADWAKYIQLHLKGFRGDVKVGDITLTKEAFAILHRPYDGPDPRYALGWVLEKRDWAGGDGTALWHNGSNTLWYCVTWLGPGNGVAALVTTNQATAKAKGATDKVAALLLQEFAHGKNGGSAR